MGRLRLVTLNCLYLKRPRARLRVIGRMLKEMSPEVACLQEIFFKRNVSLLADKRAIFKPWGFAVLGGLVTLADGVDSWRFEPFRTSVWFERTAKKGFLTARLSIGGERLTIVNTHLAANYDENWALDNRYVRLQHDQLSQLAEAIGVLPKNEALIVTGDFNVPAAAPQFNEFMDRCGLQSAMDWSSVVASRGNAMGIDNILFRSPTGRPMIGRAALCFQDQVRLPDGREVYPSDHMGLVAELNW